MHEITLLVILFSDEKRKRMMFLRECLRNLINRLFPKVELVLLDLLNKET